MTRRKRQRTTMTSAAPLPDLARIRPRLSMLSPQNCLQLHEASCSILKQTGVRVFSEEGLDLFKTAGAQIDKDLVKISPSLVEWALAAVPSSFKLHQRGSDEAALIMDGTEVYFGTGSDTFRYLDPKTGDRRDYRLQDVADCIRLCDALPEIGFVMSVGVPRDVPAERYYRHQFATMLRSTTKPIVFVCDDLADIEAIGAMAAAAAGGMKKLSKYPSILHYSEPTTPLQHSQEATDKLLYCARHRIPVTHSPAPMMGGTAPITLAGAVALGNAEMLSSLVLHQLQQPGAPFLYGHGVHHLDMKEMISVYGAPEFQVARVMAGEMGRFYHMPVWGYSGHSDSKVPDGQAAVDLQFSVLVALMAKTNLNHDVGYLESGLTGSPEMMVLADEVISMNRRFMEGVRIDEESLALGPIADVGPGGEFLSHAHSMAHWREFWLPQVFDRQRLAPWEEQGSKDLNARLREKTLAIMSSHQVSPLPESVEREIEAVLKE